VRLTPETEAAGYRVLSLGATESTNDDALRAAREGDPGRLWIVAREQRAGRGRHGRLWTSPPGNLYATLLLLDPCDAALAPQLGFVAGLALYEAVETVTGIGVPRLGLKWPNDLILDGAKVSGLLLEAHRIGSAGTLAVVIGFGLNVASAPADVPYRATSLKDAGAVTTVDAVFPVLAAAFATIFAAWSDQARTNGPDGFAMLRRRWLDRAAGLGTQVTLRLPTGERSGVFEGLDRTGRLQLRTNAGVELVDAGDLYFPNLFRATGEPVDAVRF
jgi:BirA family transcriptional regulator, biotin operon repressor / biotin---[acetyl-CoA-carboxylase] ligase